MVPLDADGTRGEMAMLKKIASRVDDRRGVVAIEASDPVAYIASQPDPRTFVVELREVVALGFADDFSADPRHPVEAVRVESTKAPDGVNVARVKMSLAQPMRPRVRSARNVIFVEADRLDHAPATAATGAADPVLDPIAALVGSRSVPSPTSGQPALRLARR